MTGVCYTDYRFEHYYGHLPKSRAKTNIVKPRANDCKLTTCHLVWSEINRSHNDSFIYFFAKFFFRENDLQKVSLKINLEKTENLSWIGF
jgi:hypothetical protein